MQITPKSIYGGEYTVADAKIYFSGALTYICPEVITCSMLNSAEHEISNLIYMKI